jgi:small subunit ribosomal protein S16
MVKIRLQRLGAKKRPQYMIVATSETAKRDGKHFEKLGYYYPKAVKAADKLQLDQAAFDSWIKKGAQMTLTVQQVIKAATPAK